MQTSQPKLSEREIAQAWAKITIIKWKKKLAINKVGNSGALLQSLKFNVLASANINTGTNTGTVTIGGTTTPVNIGIGSGAITVTNGNTTQAIKMATNSAGVKTMKNFEDEPSYAIFVPAFFDFLTSNFEFAEDKPTNKNPK